MPERWTDVACSGCGCLCDDVTLTFEGGALTAFEPHCRLGEAWFRARCPAPAARAEIQGRPAELTAALDHAAALLRQADYPLIYGLSRSAVPGQRAAVRLAERLGAVIDTTASLRHGAAIMAWQEVGEATCTLGEVRNRADLVVFWGAHPAVSHPRHAERYSGFPRGRFTPSGREGRTIVMVGEAARVHDWRLDPDGARPDAVVPLGPNQAFAAIAMLRLMLRGADVPAAAPELRWLLERMRGCRYGVVFYGEIMADEQPGRPGERAAVAGLLQLVAELNAVTRFSARRMPLRSDLAGAENVLTWQTGYPFAVDLSRGYPRYGPGEFGANELLAGESVDLCLLVGAETVPDFSAPARKHLEAIPTIVLDHPGAVMDFAPTVRFATGVYGLHADAMAYRMDNVPLALRALLPGDAPTDAWVLDELDRRS